jgi:similar to stage IV sporulation protein
VVEIEEQNFTDNGKILEKLAEMDLKPGALRKNIDYNAVTDSLINSLDEILWASIELDGTKLKVKVVPRKIAPPIIAKNIPVDIVAKKDGFVTKVISENGLAKVKAGDTVIKGQVLISGVVTSERADSRYVHSMGEIEAVTWVNKSVEKKLYNYKKIPTGNKIKKRYLHLPFIKIPLQFNETIDFYNYDSIIKEENIFFITFKEHIYEEYLLEKEPVEYDTAVEEGVLELDGYIKDENVSNIVSRKTEHEKKDDETVIVSLLVECKENIGEEREIKF